MGGEGYALEGAMSATSLAQPRSREKRARSDFPRRSPSEIFELLAPRCVKDFMEVIAWEMLILVQGAES